MPVTTRTGRMLVLTMIGLGSMAQTKAVDPLAQARQLYNEARYEEAIKAAEGLAGGNAAVPAAPVVAARAYLERFRQNAQAADLQAARRALRSADRSRLTPRDQVELAIAFGEALFLDDEYSFDDRFSAAAEQFEVALARADLLDAAGRDALFDWWAVSLDRQAQLGAESERRPIYERVLLRAEEELRRENGATSASYWLAAAARGVSDHARAVGAAVAGWVRSSAMGTRGAALRIDLDRLMTQVLLPERARQLAPTVDARPTLASLLQQWQQLKDQWEK